MILYMYKLGQLEEILNRVYNDEDVKKVSDKLAKAECGQIPVIDYIYNRHKLLSLLSTEIIKYTVIIYISVQD